MKYPFIQCYYEGRPVSGPIFDFDLKTLPVIKAGKTPMLDLASGRYNIDTVVCVDPGIESANVYTVSVDEYGWIIFHQ